ncbi:MAG: hypothetical protein ACI8RE_003454 [Ilumatobacter sp.]|jgi:hypothetical protein
MSPDFFGLKRNEHGALSPFPRSLTVFTVGRNNTNNELATTSAEREYFT